MLTRNVEDEHREVAPKAKWLLQSQEYRGSPNTWGSTRTDETVIEEGWSTDCPKAENTKLVQEDSGRQEYVHEKQTAEHSVGQHEHQFYPYTSMSLPPLNYNIVDDMKKSRVNISLFELAKI